MTNPAPDTESVHDFDRFGAFTKLEPCGLHQGSVTKKVSTGQRRMEGVSNSPDCVCKRIQLLPSTDPQSGRVPPTVPFQGWCHCCHWGGWVRQGCHPQASLSISIMALGCIGFSEVWILRPPFSPAEGPSISQQTGSNCRSSPVVRKETA